MLNNLLEDWEFIKSIKKYDKPCFSDKSFVNVNEWFATWKRRRKGEMGERGVIYVNNLINTTQQYSKNKADIESLKKLKEILPKSMEGLKNIIYTYQMDSQEEVSKEYLKCVERLKNTIEEIDNIIHSKSNFFGNCPKIISK